jgi:carboxypeptidase C (cathepsin A)
MLTYLSETLGWKEDSPYEILTGKVRPWNWGDGNRVVNVSDSLENALRHNPHLRVLVMKGATDLATPGDGITYSLNQILGNSESLVERVSHVDYDAGHMFYFNPPDLEKSRSDLLEFIEP